MSNSLLSFDKKPLDINFINGLSLWDDYHILLIQKTDSIFSFHTWEIYLNMIGILIVQCWQLNIFIEGISELHIQYLFRSMIYSSYKGSNDNWNRKWTFIIKLSKSYHGLNKNLWLYHLLKDLYTFLIQNKTLFNGWTHWKYYPSVMVHYICKAKQEKENHTLSELLIEFKRKILVDNTWLKSLLE